MKHTTLALTFSAVWNFNWSQCNILVSYTQTHTQTQTGPSWILVQSGLSWTGSFVSLSDCTTKYYNVRCVLYFALSRRRKVSYLTAYAFCHHDLLISNMSYWFRLPDETLQLHVSTSLCVCILAPLLGSHSHRRRKANDQFHIFFSVLL